MLSHFFNKKLCMPNSICGPNSLHPPASVCPLLYKDAPTVRSNSLNTCFDAISLNGRYLPKVSFVKPNHRKMRAFPVSHATALLVCFLPSSLVGPGLRICLGIWNGKEFYVIWHICTCGWGSVAGRG